MFQEGSFKASKDIRGFHGGGLSSGVYYLLCGSKVHRLDSTRASSFQAQVLCRHVEAV